VFASVGFLPFVCVEIVLSPFIPDGSQFLLQFSLHDTNEDGGTKTPASQYSSVYPPVSPSAAPSPHPTKDFLSGLNANQLALLKIPAENGRNKNSFGKSSTHAKSMPQRTLSRSNLQDKGRDEKSDEDEDHTNVLGEGYEDDDTDDEIQMHTREDPIEARLRQITELLIRDRQQKNSGSSSRRQEKRQVVFVLANYFVLFLSLIAISAEIQARAPNWLSNLESHMQNVQDCAANQEALFQCVTNGDFAGLVASVIIWLTRSVATRRIFLFGFETRQKLWSVVYESRESILSILFCICPPQSYRSFSCHGFLLGLQLYAYP
jgi:hypothetical protein